MTVREVGGGTRRGIGWARRAQRFPDRRAADALGATLSACFEDAQSMVPVDSGALRASGRTGTNLREGDSWFGGMFWGGEYGSSAVDYAVFARENGGGSDWLRESYLYEERLAETIRAVGDAVADLP